MAGMKVNIDVDTSDVQDKIDKMYAQMTTRRFNSAMYGVFNRSARHIASVVSKQVPHEYHVSSSQVKASIGKPILTIAGSSVSCSIPLEDPRRIIGRDYKASGGAKGFPFKRGKKGKNVRRKKYSITAQIVKGSKSALPAKMPKNPYGGNPPFRNLAKSNTVYTRETEKAYPIFPVAGIGIPQMPMNLSAPPIQEEIARHLQQRIEARFQAFIKGY